MSEKVKCYFARPISLYKTLQDIRDITLLESLGFEVVNPDKEQLAERYKTEGMTVFLQAVQECNVLAFRSFPDMKIPAGVFKEIQTAKEHRLMIIELPSITSERVLSVDDTREYLRLLGNR